MGRAATFLQLVFISRGPDFRKFGELQILAKKWVERPRDFFFFFLKPLVNRLVPCDALRESCVALWDFGVE